MWRVVSQPELQGPLRSAEKTKTDKYKFLCQQLGIDLVPIIFTTSGGMGEQFHWAWQRQTGTHTQWTLSGVGWKWRMR
jgi:hypothetical protein